ncbi:MAG: type I-B CRISPR-associated protein Cas7/Cst2/DevR [Caldimicrobium sp.]|nr:type I-B CRISPR-associated protein Cas7/Cst2/DevR [Caldimicrobium sp.]
MNDKEIKNITVTIIFEGSALNRDENIGGNVQSIKKLTFADRQLSFISKFAMRHYLFNTLKKAYPECWVDTPVTLSKSEDKEGGSKKKQVIQFDLGKSNILDSAELDAFGYMYTKEGISLTRKAPVGITKAVSLFPYKNDMAFYANHDMVRRAIDEGIIETSDPDPYNKEENLNLFKVSFTIDAKIFGEDCWIVNKESYNSGKLTLTIEYKKDEKQIKHETTIECSLGNEGNQYETDKGSIIIEEMKGVQKKKVTMKVNNEIKRRRIKQILCAIKNGLVAPASGEDNTIVPLFMIAAPVKVPSPIFHPYIHVSIGEGRIEVIGIGDCLKNSWIDGQKVFVMNSERLSIPESLNSSLEKEGRLYKSFEEFLSACGLCKEGCEKVECNPKEDKHTKGTQAGSNPNAGS